MKQKYRFNPYQTEVDTKNNLSKPAKNYYTHCEVSLPLFVFFPITLFLRERKEN